MGVLYADVADESTPSDAEIAAWYDAHRDDYAGPAQATARVVRFAKTPSEADDADVLALLNEVRDDIVAGRKSFAEAAAEFSDDTGSASRGGDRAGLLRRPRGRIPPTPPRIRRLRHRARPLPRRGSIEAGFAACWQCGFARS